MVLSPEELVRMAYHQEQMLARNNHQEYEILEKEQLREKRLVEEAKAKQAEREQTKALVELHGIKKMTIREQSKLVMQREKERRDRIAKDVEASKVKNVEANSPTSASVKDQTKNNDGDMMEVEQVVQEKEELAKESEVLVKESEVIVKGSAVVVQKECDTLVDVEEDVFAHPLEGMNVAEGCEELEKRKAQYLSSS